MKTYIDLLKRNCCEAEKAKPTRDPLKFTRDDYLSPENEFIESGKAKAIYIIKSASVDLNATSDHLKILKSKKKFKYPKINQVQNSNVLYVGSSSTGLKNRLKQHLDQGHRSTYALHMKTWDKEHRSNIEIEVRYYDKNLSRDVLQIIEDALRYELNPIFGKAGPNGK